MVGVVVDLFVLVATVVTMPDGPAIGLVVRLTVTVFSTFGLPAVGTAAVLVDAPMLTFTASLPAAALTPLGPAMQMVALSVSDAALDEVDAAEDAAPRRAFPRVCGGSL